MNTQNDHLDTEVVDLTLASNEKLPEPIDYWSLEDFNDILPREYHSQAPEILYA